MAHSSSTMSSTALLIEPTVVFVLGELSTSVTVSLVSVSKSSVIGT